MKILHTGDWHIGSFSGPDINGVNARYLDICTCLDSLVGKATTEKPDLIIIAGDIFHSERVWAARGLSEVDTAIHYIRLLEKIAPVVILKGTPNHDGKAQFDTLETAFAGDDSVHIYTTPGVNKVYSYGGEAALIAALPGFDRGYYRAKHPGLDKEEETEVFTKALADIIIGMKAACEQGLPSILVGHYTITGANMESGQTALFAQYEPVVEPSTLMAADYDLVCFGHIHRPQQLEACRNTFYSGAVSALNFNDEAQPRGFYIHDTTGIEPSRFIPLPTREYKTIRLEDADIAALNDGMLDDVATKHWRGEIDGKIVRVIYDCTDEHNKALNKTILESELYDDGAFWVQEITPQKITITVNRNSLGDNNRPEDNLRNYFAERDLQPEEIGALVELARPIISEATANTTEAKTGLFMPVEIEVKNYRNYRDETFSFDGIRFCTINGNNGVGKSSLFMDAMLDALFEEPREGDLTGWICNDEQARSGSIKFTFRLGDRLYRVTRTRAKSGKATLNLAEQVDGEWVDRSSEKYKDTQTAIVNTIGVDSLTLKACALIMQDQYGLFLTADKESRMNILGNILGLGPYGEMEDIASNRLTDANRQIKTLSDRAADITGGLPDSDALREQVESTTAAIKELERQQKELTLTADAARVRLNTLNEAGERALKLNGNIATLTARRAASEAAKTAQSAIILNADAILSQGEEIAAGVAKHAALVEEEKTLISDIALYDTATGRKAQLLKSIADEEATARQAETRSEEIRRTKLVPSQQALTHETELTADHNKYEAAKNSVAEMEAHREEYEKLNAAAKAAEESLMLLKAEREQGRQQHRNTVLNLEKKVELLDDSGCPILETASCRFLKDAIEAKAALPQAEADLEAYTIESETLLKGKEHELTKALEALNGSPYSQKRMTELRGNVNALEPCERQYQSLAQIKSSIQLLNDTLDDLAKQQDDHTTKKAELEQELTTINEQLDRLQTAASRHIELKKLIAEAQAWLDKERLLPVATEKQKVAEQRIEELKRDISDIESELLEKTVERDKELAAATGADIAQEEVNTIEAKTAELTTKICEQSMTLGAIKKQQENAEKARQQVKDLQTEINSLSETATRLDTLKKAFSQDGIPHNIIRSIIPIFEATATNILGQMSGGKMSVEFITEKVLKSNSKKEVTTLDIIINDSDTGRLAYMSRSGGERVKAALSVILALSEIKSTKAGVQFGFLFIDEPPFLDSQGVQAYCDALEAIQGRYADLKVMAITHDPTMKARFPQNIDIIKTAEGSKVVYA